MAEIVWLAERYAEKKREIDTNDSEVIFKDMWNKYLRRTYDWSVDLMVGISLKEVPMAEYKLGCYAELLGVYADV